MYFDAGSETAGDTTFYRRKNSSLCKAGRLPELVPSLTTLAHEGIAAESVGLAGSEKDCCWIPPSLHSLPSTPVKGEARRGLGCTGVFPACLGMPSTSREGESQWRGVGWRAKSIDRPAAPSARGEGAGSMVVGLAPLSQRARGREVLTPRGIAANYGYSSKLRV